MWNRSIALLVGGKSEQDEDGFPVTTEEWLGGIPANFTDATRQDEIVASQSGYQADQNIEIVACNYHREMELMDESTGERYAVKRTYQKDKSRYLTLTCERREQGG